MNNLQSAAGVKAANPKLLMPVLYFMMFSYAMSVTLLGPLITVFMERYQISLSNNGLITLFQGLGGVSFSLFGMFIADRFKKSSLISVLFGTYCAALILLYFASEFVFIVMLFFIVGGSTRMLEAMLNAYVGILYPNKMGFHLNIIHVFFGAGALAGPILSTVFISSGSETNLMFFVLGGFCAFLLTVFLLVKKQAGMKQIPDVVTTGPIKKVIFNRRMLLLFIVAFFYVGFAVGTSTWMPTYMKNKMNTDIFTSGLVVSSLWGGVIIGRVISSFLSIKYSLKRLLLIGTISSGTVMVIMSFINTSAGYLIGLLIAGAFIGCVLPLTVAMAGHTMPQNKGSASAVITLGTTVGLMAIPFMIGLIAENISFWAGVLCLSCVPFLMAAVVSFLPDIKK